MKKEHYPDIINDVDLKLLPDGELFFQIENKEFILSYALSYHYDIFIEDIEVYSKQDKDFMYFPDQYLRDFKKLYGVDL
jgi:hypothetical protein